MIRSWRGGCGWVGKRMEIENGGALEGDNIRVPIRSAGKGKAPDLWDFQVSRKEGWERSPQIWKSESLTELDQRIA